MNTTTKVSSIPSTSKRLNGNIIVIGPRLSGKTTYLAGLAYWPKFEIKHKKRSIYSVTPVNEEAKKLANQAENILIQGEQLERTVVGEGGFIDLPSYFFTVEVKKKKFNLNIRDYAGEIFDKLDHNNIKPEHEEFLEECSVADTAGFLLLLSDWQRSDDNFYARQMNEFLSYLDQNRNQEDHFRVAIAISKCERGELWPGRIEPNIDIFDVHLPKTTGILTQKLQHGANLEFFAISTFGVLDRTDPRPNRKIISNKIDDPTSCLREPQNWQPYNLIAPLYWLYTGKKVSAND